MGAFDDLIPASQPSSGAFDDLIPASSTPSLPLQEIPTDETLSDRIRKFLFEPEGAKTTREAIQGAVQAIPQMAVDTAKMGYKGLRMAMGGPEERTKILTEDVIPSALAQGQQTAQDIQSPFGTPEFLRGAGQMAMMAAPGLELARELRAPVEIPREVPQAEAPPVQVPPQEPLAPVTPETPPAPEAAPLPVTPAERNGQILERRKGILARKAELTARAAGGEQGLETQLAAVEAELNDPVTNPVVHAPTVESPVRHGEFAKPGYTAVETPPVDIPPEDVRYAGGEPPTKPPVQGPPPIQGPSEPVGGNVAGFEKVYGPGEIEAGGTISPEDAWDTASARAQSGKAQPYGFVDRAKTGAITPEEMGDLIYEHHRLVERAAGLEGMPEYAGASQAAKDFASNVLKPAETAWHQKGMVMQIERPVNLNTFTGMDQLMQTELGRGIKPSEAPKFTRMAEDVKNGESEVAKAVERSDAKVRARYAKVADIPIEEAVARVKQMLKDCM